MPDTTEHRLPLKNKKQRGLIAGITLIMLAVSMLVGLSERYTWHGLNHTILDGYYRLAVRFGYGPTPSFAPGIAYLFITDATYDHFGKHILDRGDLAPVNQALNGSLARGIVYDIIFSRAGDPDSDHAFAESVQTAGNVHLPLAMALSETPVAFEWRKGAAYDRIRDDYPGTPSEHHQNAARPYYARTALTQAPAFAESAVGAGHITIEADADSIYRHMALLVRVDDRYYPALPLSIFMHDQGIQMSDLTVDWGRQLTIAATPENRLKKDVHIPVDRRGRLFIPFVDTLGKDFPYMSAHELLTFYDRPHLRGNLQEFFEDRYVFIADIATGAADLGYTPLEKDAPLVAINTALFNALLTRTFYWKWSRPRIIGILVAVIVWLGLAAAFRPAWVFYGSGAGMAVLLCLCTGLALFHYQLLPVATIGGMGGATFLCLLMTLEISAAKEKKVIRTVFSRYMPENIIKKLLERPESISLGGQEETVTILFSDIAGFTRISESLSPNQLVRLLNEYFSDMVPIIQHHGGIIDKFHGDSIMAEFGIPLPLPEHADQAVFAALEMLSRENRLRKRWQEKGWPATNTRIGINTGKVVAGNMGADTVMDYTVMGDAVNLASRLESANRYYGSRLMISEFTTACLTPNTFLIRLLDFVRVKGKDLPVRIYEVYGLAQIPNDPGRTLEKGYRLYDEAAHAMLDGDLHGALTLFEQARNFCPDDPAAAAMVDRVKSLQKAQTRGEPWEPSTALEK